MFTVRTRSADALARTGTLHLAHGDVQTPAFVPLATKATVKALEPREVSALRKQRLASTPRGHYHQGG